MAEIPVSTRSRQPLDRRRLWTTVWRDWRWFALALFGLIICRSVVADWNQVPTGSMQPTIAIGDQIVVDKRAYDLRVPFTHVSLSAWSNPVRGDIVTFPSPIDGKLYVKRVVGVPGDTVSLIGNVLTINGERASYAPAGPGATELHELRRESILGASWQIQVRHVPRPGALSNFDPVTVPVGQYLVLGDNRDESFDSRAIGFIKREKVLGQARAVAFSLDYANGFQFRGERVFAALR